MYLSTIKGDILDLDMLIHFDLLNSSSSPDKKKSLLFADKWYVPLIDITRNYIQE